MIISGSSHPELSKDLGKALGQKLAHVDISKFPNGEKQVWVKDQLHGLPAIIVQSFCAPVDEHIIEFCLLADAAKHLKASKIIGVIPWLGYSPQDKLFRRGEPISAHVVARLLETVGIQELVVVDIHSQLTLKRFTIPVHEVSALPIFVNYFHSKNLVNHIAVALDAGALKRANEFASALHLPLAKFDKTRNRNTGEVSFNSLKGSVKGKHVISFDDFVSTGSTRIKAAKLLKAQGALSYTDCITHALLAGNSPRLLASSLIDKILATDSYPVPVPKRFSKLTVLPIAPLIAQAVSNLL